MSETVSWTSSWEGKQAMVALEQEKAAQVEALDEVDRRIDAANDVSLFRLSQEEFLVRVIPTSEEGLPFEFKVNRDQALEAYTHPYAYVHHIAA